MREADCGAIPPRPGLRVHVVGERGAIVDDGGHFRHAYGLTPSEWALVRPDGYIGAIVGPDNVAELEQYWAKVTLVLPFRLSGRCNRLGEMLALGLNPRRSWHQIERPLPHPILAAQLFSNRRISP